MLPEDALRALQQQLNEYSEGLQQVVDLACPAEREALSQVQSHDASEVEPDSEEASESEGATVEVRNLLYFSL